MGVSKIETAILKIADWGQWADEPKLDTKLKPYRQYFLCSRAEMAGKTEFPSLLIHKKTQKSGGNDQCHNLRTSKGNYSYRFSN